MSLREKIQHLPSSPGVYLMKDNTGLVIYVGKAKNLKNRVRNYFIDNQDINLKNRALISEISDFELILTRNEVEALLLERNLIKHHQPRYNILLRDDKEYPYIRVDLKAPWPRIEKVRKRIDDGATYIGPYGNPGLLHSTLKIIHKIFPLVRCSEHEFKNARRPCNYYHIKMCLAPCHLAVDKDDYLSMVEKAICILEGNSDIVRSKLISEMQEASDQLKYEKAAQFRDQLKALDRLSHGQVAVVNQFRDADAIAFTESEGLITFGVTQVRGHRIIGNENFIVGKSIDSSDEVFTSFILQYYEKRQAPEFIILPDILSSKSLLTQILSEDTPHKVKIFHGRKDESAELIAMSIRNSNHHFDQSNSLQLRQRAELEILKKLLHLPRFPHRIECIDISNLQGNAIVASNVCFIDGKPAKNFYRRYEVESVTDKPNDFASMYEIVSKRLKKGAELDELPDLLVIDGGKGQLNAALKAAADINVRNVDIVSIAKSRLQKTKVSYTGPIERSQERIFTAGIDNPIYLEDGSPAYRIMTRVRDEAHRFAIMFHRQKRDKATLRSSLDDIPGVGPVTKKRLLERFSSLEGIRNATIDQLIQVKGVSEKLAFKIKDEMGE